jgi:hypothetical protein
MGVDWFLAHPLKSSARPASAVSIDTDGALAALASAITQSGGDGSKREGLQIHVLDYCAHARREGVTPEQMIVRLKHILDGALSTSLENPTAQQETRTNIISMAINAYYDDKR